MQVVWLIDKINKKNLFIRIWDKGWLEGREGGEGLIGGNCVIENKTRDKISGRNQSMSTTINCTYNNSYTLWN